MTSPSLFLTRWLYRLSPVRSSHPSSSPHTSDTSSSQDDHQPLPLTINNSQGDHVCDFLMPQSDEQTPPFYLDEDPDAPLISHSTEPRHD